MDICASTSLNISELQGTNMVFQKYFKRTLFPVSDLPLEARLHTSASLTFEAACMVTVIALFVILSLLGSLITAHEFFSKRKTQENNATCKRKQKAASAWSKDIRCFLKCFCAIQNGKKIMRVDSNNDSFGCLQGIRVIGSSWYIVWHTSFFYFLTLKSMDGLRPYVGSPVIYFFANTKFTTDVFLVISGFLNAYAFSKDYKKNNGKVSLSFFYLKRFVRISPVYMVVLGFYTVLLSYTWPSSEGLGFTNLVCQENWWWHLLYLNNFQYSEYQCMSWCWYIAVEMQLYIISPLFIISLLRRPAFGYGLASTGIFSSCLVSFFITKHCNLTDGFPRFTKNIEKLGPIFHGFKIYFEKIFTVPYTRLHSYLVGVLLGVYIYKRRNSGKDIKFHWAISSCGWILSVVLMLVSVFALYDREESVIEMALYNGLNFLIFSIGFAWVIFTCVTGQGGFINTILSWKFFLPFSKLSYCVYLIHMVIIMGFYQNAEILQEFSILTLIRLCFVTAFWTFVFAFFASVLVELPFGNLLDEYRKRSSSEKKLK